MVLPKRDASSQQTFRVNPQNILYPTLYPIKLIMKKITYNQLDISTVDIKVQNIE